MCDIQVVNYAILWNDMPCKDNSNSVNFTLRVPLNHCSCPYFDGVLMRYCKMLRYAILRFIFSFLHFLFPTPMYALHQSKVLALIDVKNRLGYFSGDIKSFKAKQCWVF